MGSDTMIRYYIDYAKAFFEVLFTDKADLQRKTKIRNADGTTGNTEYVTVHADLDCKLSFGENDDSAHDTGFMLEGFQPVKLFFPAGTDVRKGDQVIARVVDINGNILGTYSGILNLPKHYTTKIEVSFVEDRVA